ncbi:MAG: glucuronate isomerase [Oscillospiraceae bacterium]|nr:glucuronate isomerase [Oscillospiraceae bacterium]
MKPFMDRDFLLETETARHLFHDWAEGLPLIDYHCHISPREIWEDRRFLNLTELWLGGKQPDGSYFGDHYKWRILRSDGAGEDYVTGEKPPYERFLRFVQALEKAPGNPMVHWCNLELRQFFGYDKALTAETAPEAWEYCNAKLRTDPELSVRGILKKAKVAFIGTTDDPADSLEWHRLLRDKGGPETLVCPSFRPDKAINIQKVGFRDYIARLAAAAGMGTPGSAQEVCEALTARLEYFCSLGCRASDHGLDTIPFRPGGEGEAEEAFRRAMAGEEVPDNMAEAYQTKLLLHLGREYRRLGVVMQLHYSCLRNVNAAMYRRLGPDTGFDMIGRTDCGGAVAALLSALEEGGGCPRTILYSLDPGDNALLGSLIGCFQSDEVPGKIQHGAAWWFNDTRAGMESQLRSLAELGLLGNFVGMLTDSRSFLSYARHDYFRRIFCNLLGHWVENGEFPPNERILKDIVEGVCYANARRYFSLEA